jgi:hypothetical protein
MHVKFTKSYASETWVLKEAIIKKFMIFERKILRRIYGPTKEKDGTWRIKTNEELDYLIKHNIINQIMSPKVELVWTRAKDVR